MTRYALYDGDELVDVGTADELAATLVVSPETVRWYSYPTWHRRGGMRGRYCVRIEDMENGGE